MKREEAIMGGPIMRMLIFGKSLLRKIILLNCLKCFRKFFSLREYLFITDGCGIFLFRSILVYLILINFLLIVISAVIDLTTVVNIFNLQNTTAYIFHILINISGYAGLALTFAGCIGLIVQRVTDEKFKFYNTPMDFANLIFILILIISISVTLVSSNSSFHLSLFK